MILDALRRRLGLFDSNGLRYSVKELASKREEIAYYPIEKQAKYADQVTVSNCNDPLFIQGAYVQLQENRLVNGEFNFYFANTTSIGNAAYLALNCKNKTMSNGFIDFLIAYKKYVEKSRQLQW